MFILADQKEEIIPVSSNIQLKCENGLRVGNIDVTIRRTNTTCLTTTTGCTLPIDAIETIKEDCNNRIACDVDIRNMTNSQRCLRGSGFVNVWYTCRTSTDFSCNFESGLCNWSSIYENDRFQWTYGLPIDNRFPVVDHTSASSTGKYAYIYSYWSTYDDIAKLESGHIISTYQQCFSFWLYKTNSRESVYVLQNDLQLLDLSKHYGSGWHQFQIPLEKTSNLPYKLIFKVERGKWSDGSFGAIVVDDIVISNQNCNSFLFECDFDTNSCDWKNEHSNQYVWEKQTGSIYPYIPKTDHSTASGNTLF
ncbi:unnamed protein product [Mytilus coruscus]|uniref:MAM domain-containing protein n=1 Tax=Mytilus coruscus TaxID=42192 RepID=A0A6J7ZVD6_MYTCO|nr:unnamed protein product [Mytilus coruscus]